MKYKSSRTKIIATVGPVTFDKTMLRKMFEAGVNVIRINFSHCDYEQAARTIQDVRDLNKEFDVNVALLADLQGPKLRVGDIENDEVFLEKDQILEFVSEKCIGNAEKVYMSYEEFPQDVKQGDLILIDDGKLKLEVIETNGQNSVKAKVIYGGMLRSRKGVNLPNTDISLPSLTEKDIADAEFALSQNVDWLALSFVRAASDVIELKQLIKRKKKKVSVISKIEKKQAVSNLKEIIAETDAIMVARGDLGVEVSFDTVPLLQKDIVKQCIDAAVPVIIATQMMESMIENFRPTRAEANDVANAVLDGVDTVMLSGETSVGKFPIETIENMHKIIQYTEKERYKYNQGTPPTPESKRFLRDNICYSASIMAERVGAKAIITFSEKGSSAKTISGYRPKADIYAFTRQEKLLSVLSLLWGVRGIYYEEPDNIDEAIKKSINILKNKGCLKPGDRVIHVASTPLSVGHKTNMLKVTKVQ
ncbi:MAG: pyruvate kinase [Bacteroidia bacterium]|nr:MAG: pyruvate kinase [Bacteroidia bacterium]